MNGGQLSTVLQFLRRLAPARGGDQLVDEQLLERFIDQRDEAAFATLVLRHGPMVLQVGQSILRNAHDAEDAFQATFLVLVRKARSISKRPSLASWLHGVAYRVAVRAKASAARRQFHERQGQDMGANEPFATGEAKEIAAILQEEVNALPEKFRNTVVLCCLEGRTREEAAWELGCTEGAVKGRLERAKELLRQRLTHRGLGLSGGLFAAAVSENLVPAAVPAALTNSTIKAAMLVAAGNAAAAMISAQAADLTQEVLKMMFLTKVKIAAVALAALMVVSSAGGLLAYQALAARETKTQDSSGSKPAPDPSATKAQTEWVEKSTLKFPGKGIRSVATARGAGRRGHPTRRGSPVGFQGSAIPHAQGGRRHGNVPDRPNN